MAEDVDTFVKRVEENSIWIALHINGLDQRKCFGIEHRDGLTAREPMSRLRINSRSMRADHRNIANMFERVQIEDRNSRSCARPRDVEPPPRRIRVNIIKAAIAANLGRLQHFVWSD